MIMTGQQLKNSILQEAIEGRLVPQDPSDEPASVLLERIRAEKARLVKEKKIKKAKNESRIYRTEDGHWMEHFEDKNREDVCIDEEIPFELPNGWEWCRMQQIIDFINGRAYKKEELLLSGKYKVLRVGNFFTNNSWYYSDLELPEEKYCNKGDLLYAWSASFGPKIWDGDKTIFHYHIWNVKYNQFAIKRDYLFYFLLYDKTQISKSTTGSTMIHVSMENMKPRIIPLPPLAEQHRIVEKIESLLPKVEAYGKAQEELVKLTETLPEQLKESILQEAIEGRLVPQDPNDEPASVLLERIRAEKARLVKEKKMKKSILKEIPFTDDDILFDIPDNWVWCKLGWIGDWGAGATPTKGVSEYYVDGTIPWLRTGELNNGYVYDSEIKVTHKALEKCSLRQCKIGDVLIAMYGATIGKVAIAGIELTTNQACCACTPFEIYNKYLLYYLMASKDRFVELGEGGAQPNISREKIVAFPFPLPPLAEQHRIVEKIESLLPKIEKLKVNQ